MASDEQSARMTKAINEAIRVMSNRFQSTEEDVARAVEGLRQSLRKEVPSST